MLAFARATTCAKRSPSSARSPVVPTTETVYMKPSALSPIFAKRSGVVVGATSGTSASPLVLHASCTSGPSPSGRSGTISPLAPVFARRSTNASAPGAYTMFA